MGVELCFVHPSCPVDFEMNQDFISSFYEQAKNVIYENKQTKTKAIYTAVFCYISELFASSCFSIPNSSYIRY